MTVINLQTGPDSSIPAPLGVQLLVTPVSPYIGTNVRCYAKFARDGEATDPDNVKFEVWDPSGKRIATAGPEHDAVGSYFVRVPTSDNGLWRFRVTVTGDDAIVDVKEFIVRG